MRFEEWDVLLFPKDSKVPIKEFKTNCHVVHDTEFAYTHGSFGLPTMTCFMPGLPPGTPFNISLHSWKTPDVSQFTRNYSKHPELVKLEARVLIDGRLVTTSSFNRTGPWPQLINHSSDFTKNGDLEVLKFPQFRSELLRQSYWSPADELGRIKIVISEGFPRDSLTVPVERVKNVIAFSFQHAPLDILESSGIAWPNPAMWRRGPFNPTMPVPSQQHEDGPEAHLHSPRRRSSFAKSTPGSSTFNTASANASQINADNFIGNMANPQSLLQRGINGPQLGYVDPFNPDKVDISSCFEWPGSTFGFTGNPQTVDTGKGKSTNRRANTHSKVSASDISMPDYSSSNSAGAQLMTDFQPMGFVTSLDEPDTSQLAPKVPVNSPTTLVDPRFVDDLGIDINKMGTPGTTPPTVDFFTANAANFSVELATSLTHSLLNQPHPLPAQGSNIAIPAHEIKSRKENRLNNEIAIEGTPTIDHIDMRKVPQSVYGQLGKTSRDTSCTSNSPPSQSTFSGVFSRRSFSGPEFGNDLTNSGILFTHGTIEPHPATESRITSGSDKGIKRTRQFTPASGKAIDDEDEPRRTSSRGQNGLGNQVAEPN
ncbi:putative NADH dehydrogenase -like protein [Rosellinia necatrix]|uniref:Putative NADH dehydrogenase-like protein n=1 Tax=Rosellinia necatrix TaxID=77044 RepID=A0A1W2TSK4_ROSNE|nr:putative NADH dehydrogenase -like protein [Rosellinia necatrix]